MKKNQRKTISFILISFIVLSAILSKTRSVYAVSYGPSEVIAAVNSLRAEYGLPGYSVSQELNTICQDQAEYMASIGQLTHDREDGSTIPTTAENIAYGPITSAMSTWTDDQPHFDTLTAWSSGLVGAGVAESSGLVYICLNVNRYGDTEFNQIPFTQAPGTIPVATVAVVEPIVEVTPVEEEAFENEEVSTGAALTEDIEPTAIAIVVEKEVSADEEVDPTAEPETDEGIVPGAISDVQPQQIAIESRTGKIAAYALMVVGVLGLGGSIYGVVYSISLMGNKKKTTSSNLPKKKKSSRKKPADNDISMEIPNEAQEE